MRERKIVKMYLSFMSEEQIQEKLDEYREWRVVGTHFEGGLLVMVYEKEKRDENEVRTGHVSSGSVVGAVEFIHGRVQPLTNIDPYRHE